MWDDSIGVIGKYPDQFPRHLGRFDAAEPDAKVAGKVSQLSEEIVQSDPIRFRLVTIPVHAEMSEMDSSQNDLAVTGISEPLYFVDDLVDRSAGELGSDVRDDAVAAAKQTAVL